jgi:hypothetical protein
MVNHQLPILVSENLNKNCRRVEELYKRNVEGKYELYGKLSDNVLYSLAWKKNIKCLF